MGAVTDKPDEPGGCSSTDRSTDRSPRRPPRSGRPVRPNLDEIFGDVLPTTTSDEREPEQPSGDRDAWYERNRPPHHDRD